MALSRILFLAFVLPAALSGVVELSKNRETAKIPPKSGPILLGSETGPITSAAKNMRVKKIEYLPAYHYELQTFTEKRETAW